ncbi:hypothetical protein JRO89_XS03G0086600 [Xanthoceras sorbifolium]|uniref:Amine oxidase domain-containing protein n=1 Tax=Xanthoceras sorbifolium TaxID=99658 RepID=A0ABQ8I975_9ROSI|nr:hypothetical protein JRO89_XS03G0086600 [Xanthoceras sorbifolium]
MTVAVIGAGMSGLVAAHVLAKAGAEVVLYEKKDTLGGHAKTVTFDGVDLDLGFVNTVTCPNMMELFESVGVEMETTEMSFSVSLDKGQGYEWGTRNGFSSLFAQKKNLLNPYFWQMLREIIKFKEDAICYLEMLENNPDIDCNETLEQFINSRGYTQLFQKTYLIPICGSIWSCSSEQVMSFPASYVLQFFRNCRLLQNIGETSLPFLVTLNPDHTPEHTLLKWSTGHLLPSVAASKASLELDHIQGRRGIWFCGAYQGYGFHEDEIKSSLIAAHRLLGKKCDILSKPRHMVPSLMETGARVFVTRFLRHYINTGHLILLEEGGTIFNFEGARKTCGLKTILKIHNPRFYWKVMTEADLGIANSYINGDFSFVDKDEGLLNLFMIFIANTDLDPSRAKLNQKRGWWSPLLFTAGIASAKYFIRHILKRNTLTQARRNISRHYDLSNELFALFMDKSMLYSCAIFERNDEDLNVAQMRKISLLIEKASISKEHELLEIGCGWGCLAIEVVKRTGCQYTGITLSEQQLKYTEIKVKEAGLQDHISLYLCDYRQLPKTNKYDRILACEMIEAVGHEYMEEFFGCCESLLAEDGLLVLQFSSVPDQHYNEHRLSPGFIKEYIFPGGCLPSLNRITTVMTSASRLCVEHVENIGVHYSQTLRCWRKNFLEKQSEVLALGFDEKFIRTWEYYFDYCAAGFKSRTLGDYQVFIFFVSSSLLVCRSYRSVEVVLYEKEDYLRVHAKTVTLQGFHLDLGFMVFNRKSSNIAACSTDTSTAKSCATMLAYPESFGAAQH